MKLQYVDVLSPKDIESAFRAASKGRAEAVLMMVVAAKSRLPVMYRLQEDVEAGGLMTYGVNISDLDRRAATYVDKILKGAKPARSRWSSRKSLSSSSI